MFGLLSGCKLQLYVDGVYTDLTSQYDSNGVNIKTTGHTVLVQYPATGFQVQIDTSIFMDHCVLNLVVSVPVGSATVGLLGSIDSIALNDWMLPNGTPLPISHSRNSQDDYDYCTKYWCITDAAQSMFTYEPGYGHADITRCKHPYTDDQTLEEVPQDILDDCDRNVPCIIDRMKTNAMVAGRSGQTREASSVASRNGYGGECETSLCFEPLECIDLGGLQGKKCLDKLPACMWDWGDCSKVPCCEGQCVTLNNGEKQCRADGSLPHCMWDWGDCSKVNCCEGKCITLEDGQKQCRIESCTPEWLSCSASTTCCDGLACTGPTNGKKCMNITGCVARYEDCSYKGCCDGLVCGADNRCFKPCGNETATCADNSDCCSGLTCDGGKCKKPCKWDSSTCSATTDCCSGLTCNSGKCGKPCGSATATCSSNTDCCSSLNCNGGKCEKPCTKEWYTCSIDSDCCTGLGCVGGLCKKTCKDEWAACSKTKVGDCCGAQTCLTTPWGSQVCRPTTCAKAWDNCSAERPCCDGLKCTPDGQGGTCK